MRHLVPSTQHSIQHSELCTLYSVLCTLYSLLRGRWSLPGANSIREWVGVSGCRFDDAAPGTIDAALDSALCTLNSVSKDG